MFRRHARIDQVGKKDRLLPHTRFILEFGKGVSTGSISPVLRFINLDLRSGKEASPDVCLSTRCFEPLTVREAPKPGRLSLGIRMRFPWLPL